MRSSRIGPRSPSIETHSPDMLPRSSSRTSWATRSMSDIWRQSTSSRAPSTARSRSCVACTLHRSSISHLRPQGYLAVTLLMHENSDFLRLVVNSIRKDLDSNNEVDNCLALHAIANVGGSEMAEALVEDVHRLLISPYAPPCSCSVWC